MLDALKSGLAAPLAGMGTAFSSSLFGLSGSLVARLPRPAGRPRPDAFLHRARKLAVPGHRPFLRHPVADPAKAAPTDEFRSLTERLRTLQETGGSNQRVATAMANLADGISGLVKNMRSEQQIMRDWVEAQSEEQKAMRGTLDRSPTR